MLAKTNHSLPRCHRRARGQGRQLRRICATRAIRWNSPQRYNDQGADELVFLDITASSDAREIMADVVARTARQVFIPLTVGGGIRSVADARKILLSGADKVSVNTAAVRRPEADHRAERRIRLAGRGAGDRRQAQFRRRLECLHARRPRRRRHRRGRVGARRRDRSARAKSCSTSMDTDGVQQGFDCDLTRAVSEPRIFR